MDIFEAGIYSRHSALLQKTPKLSSMFNSRLYPLLRRALSCSLFCFSLPAAAANPSLSLGIDWMLPAYASQSANGGMILGSGSSSADDPDVTGDFLEVLWNHSEPQEGQFNFDDFRQRLAQANGNVLVRLEVNSNCHAPEWANLPYLDNQSLQFWKPAYLQKLTGFVNAFADEFKNNSKIVGVHLGIGDGEYYQDANDDGIPETSNCPTGNSFSDLVYGSGRTGWGEFWVDENLDEHVASEANGLTPAKFERSVKSIIDMYADAFGAYSHKLAFTSFGVFGPAGYNARMPAIVSHSMGRGIGNRGGEIEAWMRYTNQVYGVDMQTGVSNDGSCLLTFDDSFADSIAGRYWGEENEFYGTEDWILDSGGPLSNQAYRFYVSSMRALQMRRNYVSVSSSGHRHLRSINNRYEYQYTGTGTRDSSLLTKFRSGDFLTYLSKTLGRTRSDTPDAFVILGERTMSTYSGLYPPEYRAANTSEQCLIDAESRGYATVSEFGRWLSVVSPTTADTSMRKDMPEDENNWGLNMIADRNGAYYELYARKASSMLFDINDQLMQERCASGCDIEVKVVFKDDRRMQLQVEHAAGTSVQLATPGGGQTRTATFPISGMFINGFNDADFSVQTVDGSELSVLMARVNIVSSTTSTCDAGVTLKNNLWAMLSLPCEPPAGATIGNMFGDDIIINGERGSYATDWRVFVYDSQQADYVDPGVNGTLAPGQGFWIIQRSGHNVALALPAGSQLAPSVSGGIAACQSGAGCINLPLGAVSTQSVNWNLLGNPFPGGIASDELRVSTSSGACSTGQAGCTLAAAAEANVLNDVMWHYNEEKTYSELSSGTTINRWQGFWAAGLPAAVNNLPVLHIPAP